MRRWFALALVSCGACLFPSLDDLSSNDASTPDSSVDVATDVAIDAVSEASGDASDAAARFCALHPAAVFCDDFDDASTLSPSWTIVNLLGDAAIEIAQDTPVSSPNIARSTVGATSNSGEASFGRHVIVTSGQTLSFGAALRADDWPAGPYASVASIYTDQTHSIALVLGYNNKSPLLVIDQPGDAASSTFPVTLPQGWFRMTFVLAVSGATSTVDLLVDGQTAVGGPKPGPPISTSQITVYLGLYATSYTAPITWSFDDAYAQVN